jgi:hypothetical protein
MRKWLVLVVLLMAFQINADAFLSVEAFDFTGYSYYKDDVVGWHPNFNVPTSDSDYGAYTTHGAASNTTGYAFKFSLNESTEIDNIIFDEVIINEQNSGVEDFDNFKISIYDTSICSPYLCRPGEAIQDWSYVPGHLAYQSDRLFFSDKQYRIYDENGNTIEINASFPPPYLDNKIDANVKLDAGEHWVSVEWDYQDRSAQSRVNNFRYSPVPEPSTILLLGGGLAGAFWRLRKNSKV